MLTTTTMTQLITLPLAHARGIKINLPIELNASGFLISCTLIIYCNTDIYTIELSSLKRLMSSKGTKELVGVASGLNFSRTLHAILPLLF